MEHNYWHEEEYKGFTLTLEQDDNPIDPREWDNFSMMVTAHPRYLLGDYMVDGSGWVHKERKNESVPFYNTVESFTEWLKEQGKLGRVLFLPLYLYDHSGISMRTGTFTPWPDYGGWDSGLVGYIYVTREQIFKEFGWKGLTSKRKNKIFAILQQEVMTYNDYLMGNVVGWQVWRGEPDESELIESVWGYYGEDGRKQAIQEAKDAIDWEITHEIKTNGQQLILPDMEEYLPEEARLEKVRLETIGA
jgi:hypothetical protein